MPSPAPRPLTCGLPGEAGSFPALWSPRRSGLLPCAVVLLFLEHCLSYPHPAGLEPEHP